MELFYKEDTYKIIGACFEVYSEKGSGFVEPVYQECLEMEFGIQGIAFSAQASLRLSYKGRELKQRFIPDFMCCDRIVVELNAVTQLTDEHRAQVLNYLKATGYRLGLLTKLGHYPKLEYERIIL